jgi:hypothetical protein
MKLATLIPTQSAAVDITSAAIELGDIQSFSVSVDFTGSNIVGTLTLECSNESATAGFTTVASSSQAVTSSADHMWSVSGAGYRWVRVFWDYTSGTGNITAKFVGKETLVKPC